MFNVQKVLRLKGNNITAAAETWKGNEELPIIVRLKCEDDTRWIVGHRGYVEIFRSPIVMQAQVNSMCTKTVHVLMQQWTKRKDDPILRQFCLSFGCNEIAEAFAFTHNCFLSPAVHTRLQLR